VVPTPLGNLKDVTLRVLDVLAAVDLVLCEDTRRTRKLLSHYRLSKQLVSCERFSEARRVSYVLGALGEGKSLALVSDAGMPGISDPGTRIIQSVRREGYEVVVLPGPSAIVTAFAASGIDKPFRFIGFLPRKTEEKRLAVHAMLSSRDATVFYESPRRLLSTLKELAAGDPGRFVCIAREMTKIHEEYLAGSAREVLSQLEGKDVRGELTVVVDGSSRDAEPSWDAIDRAGMRLLALGVPLKEASAVLADVSGLSRTELYRRLLASCRKGP